MILGKEERKESELEKFRESSDVNYGVSSYQLLFEHIGLGVPRSGEDPALVDGTL